jgi:hypothetical protein
LCSAQSFGGAAARLPGSNNNDGLLTRAGHVAHLPIGYRAIRTIVQILIDKPI